MRYITLILALILGALLLGCGYTAPPGGEDSYCYRIEYDRQFAQDILLVTNTEPEWRDGDLVLQDVWFAFYQEGEGSRLRFDRHADHLTLTQGALGAVVVRGVQPCMEEEKSQ